MGHQIGWDNNDKTVVLQQYAPPVSNDDLLRLAEESAAMLKTVPHIVHLIVDERGIRQILSKADLRYLERLVPPNQGAVVVVVEPADLPYKAITQRLGNLVAPHAVSQTYFATSLEEARSILQQKVAVQYP